MRDDRSGLLGIDRQVGLRIQMSRFAVGMTLDQLTRGIGVPVQLLSDFEEGATRYADRFELPRHRFCLEDRRSMRTGRDADLILPAIPPLFFQLTMFR